jgi:type IV pilus assembly protein PilA
MRKQKGFSLIELLIVITIILIIAAIAVPNLLRSKMAANEASAVGSVRTISNGQALYATTYPDTGFTSLATLGGAAPCTPSATTACIIDATISGGTKSGYNLKSVNDGSGPPALGFSTNADPVKFNSSGTRHFFSDQTFVITYTKTDVAATASSTALQ